MKQKRNTRQKFIITLVLIMLLALAGAAYGYSKVSSREDGVDVSKIDYSPPTPEEQASGNEQKERLDDEEAKPDGPRVEVVVVDAGQYGDDIEVRAFAQGIIEGGTCKAIFTQNSLKVEKTSDAFIDATTTQCGNLSLPRSEFPGSGEWVLSVVYESENNAGMSEEWKVNIE